jgi:hypothetical protein
MTEHIRRRRITALFEQMWRSSEAECSRLEAENARLTAGLQEIAWHNPQSPEAAIARQLLGVALADQGE